MNKPTDRDGHINRVCLGLYATGYSGLRKDAVEYIMSHLTTCEVCKNRFNECLERAVEARAEEEAEERARGA